MNCNSTMKRLILFTAILATVASADPFIRTEGFYTNKFGAVFGHADLVAPPMTNYCNLGNTYPAGPSKVNSDLCGGQRFWDVWCKDGQFEIRDESGRTVLIRKRNGEYVYLGESK